MNDFVCNICGSTTPGHVTRRIDQPDRFERSMGISEKDYQRQWVICDLCGVAVNLMSDASREAVTNLGASYYEVDLGGGDKLMKKYNRVMSLPDMKSDNALRVDRILSYLRSHAHSKKTIRICDVGSGLGVFLSKVFAVFGLYGIHDIDAVGVEPDPTSFAFLQKLGLFPVRCGFFPEAVSDEVYDLITLNKVLEHIENPRQLLSACGKHLTFSGLLYVEVPCVSNLRLKAQDDNSLGSLHNNLYDLASLSKLLRIAGFTSVFGERIIEPSGKISVYVFAKKTDTLSP